MGLDRQEPSSSNSPSTAPILPSFKGALALNFEFAKLGDGSPRFPNLAAHFPQLLLTPGSLKVDLMQLASSPPPDVHAKPKTTALSVELSDSTALLQAAMNDAAAMAELESADFELYCAEELVKALARQPAVKVPLKKLQAANLSEAADFLEKHHYNLKAQRKTLQPFAIIVDFADVEIDLKVLPVDVRAELSRNPFSELATRLLDEASLKATGFCSTDALDPRFIYNRLAPIAPGVELDNERVKQQETARVRLIRVKPSSSIYTAFQRQGTRISMTRTLSRAASRLASGSFFIRYIASYEPFCEHRRRDLDVDPRLEGVLLNDIKGTFARQPNGNSIGPVDDNAYIVVLSNQDQAPDVLDKAQDVILRCLSAQPPEDVHDKRQAKLVQLDSQDELSAALKALAAEALVPDMVIFSNFKKPQKPWVPAPDDGLSMRTRFVNVRELNFLATAALRWFLDQPVALVAARATLRDVEALVLVGISPQSLARLAWLSPPKQRDTHKWLKPLRVIFDKGM